MWILGVVKTRGGEVATLATCSHVRAERRRPGEGRDGGVEGGGGGSQPCREAEVDATG